MKYRQRPAGQVKVAGFCLAYAIEETPAGIPAAQLGDRQEWQVEWKWDGIRAQLIRRQGEIFLWSRGEELVTDRYPEVNEAAHLLPNDVVLDGELLPWGGELPMPFTQLQLRIERKTLSKKLLAEVPVVFLAYDLLEYKGEDWRNRPLSERRAQLAEILAQLTTPVLRLSPVVQVASWEELATLRAESRQRQVEGFMLKRVNSPYRVGRQRGDWWKWKIEPYTVDAVLINAQRGSGKRASLYTDYTFGVWDESGKLVPFAKAYSGLTDVEIRQVDRFVRANTLEKFGPVRSVKPALVFELAFEAIQRSNRHKSGIAVRFPRILRLLSPWCVATMIYTLAIRCPNGALRCATARWLARCGCLITSRLSQRRAMGWRAICIQRCNWWEEDNNGSNYPVFGCANAAQFCQPLANLSITALFDRKVGMVSLW